MKKLKIVDKNNYEYFLQDEQEKNYQINLEFMELENRLKTGDYIYINDELLNEKYEGFSTWYTFGKLTNKYGKDNILKDDIDVIKVVIDGLEIYLKRLYG